MRRQFLLLAVMGLAAGEVQSGRAAEWLSIEAEQFQTIGAECRDFGGVVGICFPKPESMIRTSISLREPVKAEVWARVYFSWGGSDALTLRIDDQTLAFSANAAAAGSRWEVGNYQVWHWVCAGTASLAAGRHAIDMVPTKGARQRVDQIVFYWGEAPAWTQPWLTGCPELAKPTLAWTKGDSLAMAALGFRDVAAGVETLGQRQVAVLRGDADRLRTSFGTSRPMRATIWARVYFEAKNMFEGLTAEELANCLCISLDGQLQKTVFEQNVRQWHWVATDVPCELKPGPHLITLEKRGPPVKIDEVVVYAGQQATEEPWFRAPPPAGLSLGLAEAPEVARAGNWRAHAADKLRSMTFLGERDGPARFPVKVALGPEPGVIDFVRVAQPAENPIHGDRTGAQQIDVWMYNSGQPVRVEALYSDRHGECFLQALEPVGRPAAWRLFSAPIPLHLDASETFFDGTGESPETVLAPRADAQSGNGCLPGIRSAGGDGNRTPDFPLEVRALRVTKPAGLAEIRLGDPQLESPCTLRCRLASQTAAEAVFEIEALNGTEIARTASVYYRFASGLGDLHDPAAQTAVLQRRDVPVPPRGKAAFRTTLPATEGIWFLECRLGSDRPLRRYVGKQHLADEQRQAGRAAGALRFARDGSDRPLKKPDGTPLTAADLPAAYGADKGLVVTDDGLDVCSLQYAARRDFAYRLEPRGFDLSDEAGWPNVHVPCGVLAIDPALGRFKFAEADPSRLALCGVEQTGFGVPGPRVTVRGRYAYVAPGEGQYSVVDCADKAHPRVISHISSWYFSYHLLPFRDYGYFESSHRGLLLVDDLSNPHRPGPLRSVSFNRGRYGRLAHVFEEQAVAYSLGGEKPSLWAMDISNPLYPREIASVADVTGWFPCGQYAFTYSGEQVRLLDVSVPSRPKLLPGGIPRSMPSKDGKTESAQVLAASPEHVALRAKDRIDVYRYRAGESLVADKIVSMDVPEKSGRHVFGAFHRGLLYVIDGKNGPGQYGLTANSPASRWFVFELLKGQQVGVYEHAWPSAFGNMTIAGNTAYVADYDYGLWLFDLANPRAPKLLGGAATAGESDGLWLEGTNAYQWQTFGGAVFLLDVARPELPKRLGEYWDGAWVSYGGARRGNNTIAGKDGFLYMPRSGLGLSVVDARDPAKPQRVGEFKDDEGKSLKPSGACVDVWGDRAYVLATKKLLLYDVSAAGQPRLLSTLAIPPADLLCAKGDRLYLGYAKGGLTVVDVADAARPIVLSTLDLAPYCPVKVRDAMGGLAVAKGHVYATAQGANVADGGYLHVVDVRDPRHPRWVRTVRPKPDLPESPGLFWAAFYQDLVADGDYLFIGDYGEIQCLSLADPGRPRLVDALHVGFQWSVGRKRGPHLYVPALSGLEVLRAPSSSQVPQGTVEALGTF